MERKIQKLENILVARNERSDARILLKQLTKKFIRRQELNLKDNQNTERQSILTEKR